MTKLLSPLRYPGGKTKIYDKVKTLIEVKHYGDLTYIEPFAGGFGIGLNLLANGIVQSAVLNDIDKHIYNFWHSVFKETDALCQCIEETPITLEMREYQKVIYADKNASPLADGFATLYLNRVNYSGIIKGGPIGGFGQQGDYKIDCRFNKEEIIRRIIEASKLKNKVILRNSDAINLIKRCGNYRYGNSLLYIDPPYVEKGNLLYTNFYQKKDHLKLSRIVKSLVNIPWFVTYDDSQIIKDAYFDCHIETYDIQYNASGSSTGKELVITNIDDFVW